MKQAPYYYKLQVGYAMRSSKRHPKEPSCVVVGEYEVARAKCVGTAFIEGSLAWLAWKMPGKRVYFFQQRPW